MGNLNNFKRQFIFAPPPPIFFLHPLRQPISSVGPKLILRRKSKLLRTFTTPNALLSLILKMLGRMPTYCMPGAYPLHACHPPTPLATSRMLYHIRSIHGDIPDVRRCTFRLGG